MTRSAGCGANFGIQPWRCETFKFFTDPELEAKIRDVVGCISTRRRTRSCSRSRKSPKSKSCRTAPMLPMRPGLPERQTHDYLRRGTTTLSPRSRSPLEGHRRLLPPPPGVPQLFEKARQDQPPARSCTSSTTTTPPTNIPTSKPGWSATRGSSCTSPELRSWLNMVEDLLRDHHPPSHPPRQLHQRPRPHRHHHRFIDSYNDRCQPVT
jgi:hypothetical protein